MRTRLIRLVALALLTIQVAGCVTWRPTTVGPRQLIDEDDPWRVRVTLQSGRQVSLRDPVILADSLVGTDGGDTVRVAISDVSSLEVGETSVGRSLGLVGLVFAGVVTAAFIGSAAESGSF